MQSFNSILKSRVLKRNSWLCIGLDISPESLGSDNIDDLKEHTFKVIDSTREYAVAYKPNFAFFERWGAKGFSWLENTIDYIGFEHILIADAKEEISAIQQNSTPIVFLSTLVLIVSRLTLSWVQIVLSPSLKKNKKVYFC